MSQMATPTDMVKIQQTNNERFDGQWKVKTNGPGLLDHLQTGLGDAES